MLTVDSNNNIVITRGDSATLTLTVRRNGAEYDYSNDFTQFTVKRNTVTKDIILQKTFSGHSISLTPEDTSDLHYSDMVYDVQLITPGGDVHTVIGPAQFQIAEEVNFNVSRT